jgi:hypothetical protein
MGAIVRVLLTLQHLFMLWMLIDAIRRRADYYWYLVMFVPFGEWAYFFMVKIHDFRRRDGVGPFRIFAPGKPKLTDLRYAAERTPSLLNKRQLADGLHDAGEFDEAKQLYDEVLRRDNRDKDALYGAAACCSSLAQHQEAIAMLERLVDLDAAYRDREPWIDLAREQRASGDLAAAEATLRRLLTGSTRLPHRLALAEVLVERDATADARELLEHALRDHDHAPAFQRRAERPALKAAQKLHRSLG